MLRPRAFASAMRSPKARRRRGTKSKRCVLAALRGFLDCYEDSEECGMVCADGVYEKGTVDGAKFTDEAKKLGKSVR